MKEHFSRKRLLIFSAVGIAILVLIIAVIATLIKHQSADAASLDEEIVAIAEETADRQEPTESVESSESAEPETVPEQEKTTETEKKTVTTKKTEQEKSIVQEEPKEQTEPDTAYTAEEYYRENSEQIIAVMDVKESEEVQTEKDVVTDLKDRGFDDFSVTYDCSIDGEYNDTTAASENSGDKHPMYQTFYVTENGDVWTIFAINGAVFANPVFYNLESDLEGQLLFSESEELTSYDDETNQFYVTVPEESAVVVKVVDRIDAETLNKLTYEEIKNYE